MLPLQVIINRKHSGERSPTISGDLQLQCFHVLHVLCGGDRARARVWSVVLRLDREMSPPLLQARWRAPCAQVRGGSLQHLPVNSSCRLCAIGPQKYS